jgi:DNA-binding SARP family transcriptional activator
MAGIYEDWADERRQFYVEQSARVLSALAKLAVSEKRWTDALKFSTEVLKADPYREDMHRLTMKVLAAQGKPAAVKKHFDSLSKLLKDELGIEPSGETRRLYGELSS